MVNYSNNILLPRIEKVVFSDKWKDSKVQGGQGASHFCAYDHLEQYEDILRRARYADADLFDDPDNDPCHRYVVLRDLKMLEALEADTKENTV
jgi:hypothetical protein